MNVAMRQDYYQPEAYRDGIKAALDVMHASMPRTLVQVVAMFDVTPLTELSTGALCDSLQAYVHSMCSMLLSSFRNTLHMFPPQNTSISILLWLLFVTMPEVLLNTLLVTLAK